eukprot:1253251-Prymnesium_polylepis.1
MLRCWRRVAEGRSSAMRGPRSVGRSRSREQPGHYPPIYLLHAEHLLHGKGGDGGLGEAGAWVCNVMRRGGCFS